MITLSLSRETIEALIAAAREERRLAEGAVLHAREQSQSLNSENPDPDDEDDIPNVDYWRRVWRARVPGLEGDAARIRAALVELEAAAAAQGVRP